MFAYVPLKPPQLRDGKTAILLKRCSLSAGCHLIALGLSDAGTAVTISAWLCKSFLVEIEARAPGGSITEMPQWSSGPESRKPARVIAEPFSECSPLL